MEVVSIATNLISYLNIFDISISIVSSKKRICEINKSLHKN